MSCGRPHDVDCREILDALDSYLDGEDTAVDRAKIAQHLDECGPCLQEHHIEQLVKARIARACAGETCSETVRTRIVTRIREVYTNGGAAAVVASETTVTAVARPQRDA